MFVRCAGTRFQHWGRILGVLKSHAARARGYASPLARAVFNQSAARSFVARVGGDNWEFGCHLLRCLQGCYVGLGNGVLIDRHFNFGVSTFVQRRVWVFIVSQTMLHAIFLYGQILIDQADRRGGEPTFNA